MMDFLTIVEFADKKISVYFILYYFGNFVKQFLNFLRRGIEKMNFPEKLKCFREEHGYTQAELGKLIGVSDAAISMYEQGKRKPDMYKGVKIATLMGTTCEELVSERK